MPKLLGEVLPKEISYLGRIKLNGNTTITKSFLTTSSTLISSLGAAKINATINNLNDEEKAEYNGDIDFENFDWSSLKCWASYLLYDIESNFDILVFCFWKHFYRSEKLKTA